MLIASDFSRTTLRAFLLVFKIFLTSAVFFIVFSQPATSQQPTGLQYLEDSIDLLNLSGTMKDALKSIALTKPTNGSELMVPYGLNFYGLRGEARRYDKEAQIKWILRSLITPEHAARLEKWYLYSPQSLSYETMEHEYTRRRSNTVPEDTHQNQASLKPMSIGILSSDEFMNLKENSISADFDAIRISHQNHRIIELLNKTHPPEDLLNCLEKKLGNGIVDLKHLVSQRNKVTRAIEECDPSIFNKHFPKWNIKMMKAIISIAYKENDFVITDFLILNVAPLDIVLVDPEFD